MPSTAYHRWARSRAAVLDGIEAAHAAIGGTGPGRRSATRQVNHGYALLLAAEFQGFCRDLHTESVTHLVSAVPPALQPMMWVELLFSRQLDRGNPNPGNIGSDFNRLGVQFWTEVNAATPRAAVWQQQLEELNRWRNAIAHSDYDPAKLGGRITLRVNQVRRWRRVCHRLARAFDRVMANHLRTVTGVPPW